MRKTQKKQAEDYIRLLGQAHLEIKKALETKKYELARDLLGQCQDSAIELGNMIEQAEGEGAPTVPFLEEYCELVYRIHENIWQRQKLDTGRLYKALKKQLTQIENSVRNDISVQTEAVFLPYKASMWDSLESVWQAAAEDPNCTAYVIPIPYYDKNPDGSFREMHYEGDLYPPYVPVTDYREYDFAEHRPDMVFIHNPYDQYNLVTTVHPFFYSESIRQFTDCLVYIPYYEIGRVQAESFYTLPLYFTVDYIVVQSKQHMRQFDKRISNKILIAGSPKFDKIINRKIETEEIPESWKSKINFCDKIFFYNTSITGLLRNSVQTIEKMRFVFEVFAKSDATLIWRPHPLFESTIRAMRPEVLEIYREAMDVFEQLKYGILDITSDSSLGIKISDAYIGEETSSIVHLFGVLGKPIFISNVVIHEDYTKEIGYARYFDVDEEGDILWMAAGDRNGLIRYEKKSETVKLFEIPNERTDGLRLYNAVVSYGNCLYLIPYNGSEIAVFNKVTEQFMKIPFRDPLKANFVKAYVYQKRIYMVPARYPAILELDCETNMITYIDIPDLDRYIHDSEIPFSFNGNMLTDSILLIALAFDDLILQFDLSNREMKIIEINTGNSMGAKGFWCMEGKGEHMILGSNMGRKLVYWNRITNECKTLEPYPKDWRGDDKCFFEMACLDDDVYVFPKTGNKLLKINLESLQIESFGEDVMEFCNMNSRKNQYYNWASNTFFAKCTGEHILFQRACDLHICEIRKTKEIKKLSVDLSKMMKETDIGKNFCDRGRNLPWAVKETRLITIPRFIQYVRSETHDTDRQIKEYGVIADNLDGTAGEKIYRRIAENDTD